MSTEHLPWDPTSSDWCSSTACLQLTESHWFSCFWYTRSVMDATKFISQRCLGAVRYIRAMMAKSQIRRKVNSWSKWPVTPFSDIALAELEDLHLLAYIFTSKIFLSKLGLSFTERSTLSSTWTASRIKNGPPREKLSSQCTGSLLYTMLLSSWSHLEQVRRLPVWWLEESDGLDAVQIIKTRVDCFSYPVEEENGDLRRECCWSIIPTHVKSCGTEHRHRMFTVYTPLQDLRGLLDHMPSCICEWSRTIVSKKSMKNCIYGMSINKIFSSPLAVNMPTCGGSM